MYICIHLVGHGSRNLATMTEDQIDEFRLERLKENRFKDAMIQVLIFMVFIFVTWVSSTGGKDRLSYMYTWQMRHFYTGTWHYDDSFQFDNV